MSFPTMFCGSLLPENSVVMCCQSISQGEHLKIRKEKTLIIMEMMIKMT